MDSKVVKYRRLEPLLQGFQPRSHVLYLRGALIKVKERVLAKLIAFFDRFFVLKPVKYKTKYIVAMTTISYLHGIKNR